MTISIFRKLQVYIVLSLVQILYVVDWFTSGFLRFVAIVVAFILIFQISKIPFYTYAYYAAEGYFYDNYLSYATPAPNPDRVLGAAVKKSFPILINKIDFPSTTAEAIYVVDKGNDKVLVDQHSNDRLASASTTKLMTALVALDVYSSDDTVKVLTDCAEEDSTKIGFPEDSEYKFEDIFNAMLIASAGDAACAIAEGKIPADEFVYRMNQKSYQLGMTSTLFTNAIGLDGVDSSHFSSAQDLYKLADAAMKKPEIAKAVKTKNFTITSLDGKFVGKTESTNKLLWEIPETIGIKTGKTAEAKEVLIYEFKDSEKDLVIIVMGSEDRFSDTRSILNWLLTSYTWH